MESEERLTEEGKAHTATESSAGTARRGKKRVIELIHCKGSFLSKILVLNSISR